MSPEILIGKTDRLAAILVERVESEARGALAARGRFSIALTGGSVARTFFPHLVDADVVWTRTELFWGDERAVPPDDPESNYALARRLWLEPARVPPERAHRMPADAEDLHAAAAAYAEDMRRVLGDPPRLDVALLGVGPDGHVCSLFPGHPLLCEERRLVVAIEDSPKPPPRRMTLTLPALTSAGLVVVAALGDAKAAPIYEALEDPESSLPVALAARGAGRTLFLLDDPAARLL